LNNSNHVGLYAELSRIVSQDLIQKWLEVSSQKDSKKTFQRNKMYSAYVFLLKDPVRLVKELLGMNYGKRTHVMKTISSYVKFVDMINGTDYIDYVRKLFRKADLGWRDENIRVFEKQEILTEDQVLRIIEILKEHSLKLALRGWFMVETGLRTGEVKIVTWNNIDFNERIVKLMLIRRSKKAYFSFISKELAETLMRYKDKIMGRPFIVHSMREHYAEESVRKEIPYFRWYLFRKFNASYLVSRGIPESIVDLFQGRAPKSILQQSYLRLSLEYLRDLHDKAFSELSQKIQKILL
jgi:integrase